VVGNNKSYRTMCLLHKCSLLYASSNQSGDGSIVPSSFSVEHGTHVMIQYLSGVDRLIVNPVAWLSYRGSSSPYFSLGEEQVRSPFMGEVKLWSIKLGTSPVQEGFASSVWGRRGSDWSFWSWATT
jgi:hypothetical protein